jgi:hypothetical protein
MRFSFEKENLIDQVINPTVQKLLGHFKELKMMFFSMAEMLIGEHDDEMTVLLRNLVLEMFACKLGTAVVTQEWELSRLELNDDQKTKLKRILTSHCAKLRSGAGKLTEALLAKVTSPEDTEKDSGGGRSMQIVDSTRPPIITAKQQQSAKQKHTTNPNNTTYTHTIQQP